MSEPQWSDERELGSELVAALIEEQFPSLAPVKATFLDEGWDSEAFEVAGTWLFRFPKRAGSERALAVERALLPRLAPRLPVPIPAFAFIGHPSARFPFHFVGYHKLEGTSMLSVAARRIAVERIAPVLGAFLSELHAFPIAEARLAGVADDDGSRSLARMREAAQPHLSFARRVASDALVNQCTRVLSDEAVVHTPSPLTRCLCHNDLTEEHILLGSGGDTVTGIVDWGDLAIGDPTIDFAGLFHWLGEPLLRAVLPHYRGATDPALIPRARCLAACLGLMNIAYGVDTGRAEYTAAGCRALENVAASAREKPPLPA
ncbi:MAG: aminoglycoside phosphotransferase [Myxococcales bacterium]|nr:aminoglycoside phosphotransferase [Myxococcales bacterium]